MCSRPLLPSAWPKPFPLPARPSLADSHTVGRRGEKLRATRETHGPEFTVWPLPTCAAWGSHLAFL